MTAYHDDETLPPEVADILRQQQAEDVRRSEMEATYPADVRALYAVMMERTGVAHVIRQLLRAVHRKQGQLDLHELHRLDFDNRARVLRLVEVMAMPSILPDAGLSCDLEGRPILTADEITVLLADDE
ncbi:hypothetical protein [Paracoccus fontiphilus]|jgi:hypothetical protein|uniref:hypothetical protein n=1 Tax=Paracoccus fontiphilus TaxID=1815556 RepID=UPI001A958068|nr:hypothetical protein [Paracoccus fontiphilus]